MFKYKQIIIISIGDYGTKNFEIMVSLKYLSTFGRPLEMPLINCENNIILSCYESIYKICNNCTKLYVPVLTLSTEDNRKLLEQ